MKVVNQEGSVRAVCSSSALPHLEDKVALTREVFQEQFLRDDGKPYSPSYSHIYHPKP